ncbi:MAG TPA: universal stress protein [Solirubrobacterales bacterium]
MTTLHFVLLAIALAFACSTGYLLVRELRRRRAAAAVLPSGTRILFPFVGEALSTPAFNAALRLARAENATLAPAYLAVVPLSVAIETPLRKEAEAALPLLEAVEQKAMTYGVAVDSRIERGRTVRHALSRLMDEETFDRIVAAGASNGDDGFSSEDVAWLLEHAQGEVVIVRPGRERAELPPRSRDQRGDHAVRRVLLRVPEHPEDEAAVS